MNAFLPRLTADDLTTLRLFHGESPDGLEWLLDVCSRRRLEAEEVLLEPGQVNDTLFVVLLGELEVKLARGGTTITTLGRGECAGELSILDSKHTSAWVVAGQRTDLMEFDAQALWTLITRSHCVCVNLLGMLAGRVRRDNEVIDMSHQLKSFYEHHAKVDSLTGLHNRRGLDSMLERMAKRSVVSGQPLSMIMTDLDHFKAYNDKHGHLAGDAVLRITAGVIRTSLRPNDIAARYGGEEVVILLPNTGLRKALDIAQRLCDAVRSVEIIDERGVVLPSVTMSAGVAAVPDDSAPIAVLAAADEALYRAKHQGRDRASI